MQFFFFWGGGLGTTDRRFSGVRGPNFTKLGRGIVQSFLHKKFVSEFRYLAAFSNAGGSKLSDILNDAKFPLFAPPPSCENYGRGGRDSIPIVEALPIRLNLRNTFDGRPLRGC